MLGILKHFMIYLPMLLTLVAGVLFSQGLPSDFVVVP